MISHSWDVDFILTFHHARVKQKFVETFSLFEIVGLPVLLQTDT